MSTLFFNLVASSNHIVTFFAKMHQQKESSLYISELKTYRKISQIMKLHILNLFLFQTTKHWLGKAFLSASKNIGTDKKHRRVSIFVRNDIFQEINKWTTYFRSRCLGLGREYFKYPSQGTFLRPARTEIMSLTLKRTSNQEGRALLKLFRN